MDPTANLNEIRTLCEKSWKNDGLDKYERVRLVELIEALDEWICKGGFLPAPWQPCGACGGHGGSCRVCAGTGRTSGR
jgi:hypothetical protein